MALTNAFTQKVDRVADINATKLAWNLVVGVVRLYEIPSSWNPTDVCSLELVLQDEMGDRIHCSIPKANVVVFKTVVREFGIYSMRNFIVQPNSKGVRTTSHKFKLSFYMKTSVSTLSSETFQLNPFRFVSFTEIEAVDVVNLNILLDCVGHIVGKEDVRPMVTKSGQESKCMALYLEDLEKNKIKCTIFGEMIGKLTPFINKDDGEPLILVAQLFKPNQYLNQINIQNSLYASRVFLNPDFPDVVAFKNRLLKEGNIGSQRINHIETQHQYSVSDELSGGSFPINTIEEVLNMTYEVSTWVLAAIVSVDVGTRDWYYASCKNCPRKVVENKGRYYCEHCRKVGFNAPLRYRLNVVVTDGTGCINIMLWNQEAKIILEKSANDIRDLMKNLTSVDQAYNAVKISDDEALIDLYSSHGSSIDIGGVEQGLSNVVSTTGNNDLDLDGNGAAIVSLSKDSGIESIFESGLDTPGKCVIADSAPSLGVSGLTNPEGQGSSNKTFKRGSTKRKIE
ncbi:replication protein A 70 kDa DNA-binding subunit B-like [Arachis duranensis]|uniref:Replication protein A 70 kDa DNA-binding subunit B-like n=1 Tax=Arachis duranensis TaxID=130453 RepID=A0A6P5MHA8_ARADU|nr:replication protein A 70 kDa DNA-binding subunit B-like [Arachis duranensis]